MTEAAHHAAEQKFNDQVASIATLEAMQKQNPKDLSKQPRPVLLCSGAQRRTR